MFANRISAHMRSIHLSTLALACFAGFVAVGLVIRVRRLFVQNIIRLRQEYRRQYHRSIRCHYLTKVRRDEHCGKDSYSFMFIAEDNRRRLIESSRRTNLPHSERNKCRRLMQQARQMNLTVCFLRLFLFSDPISRSGESIRCAITNKYLESINNQ